MNYYRYFRRQPSGSSFPEFVGRWLRALAAALVFFAALLEPGARAGEPAQPGTEGGGTLPKGRLHVQWERTLTGALETALDIRWASDTSVFVAASRHGVFEVPVGESQFGESQFGESRAEGEQVVRGTGEGFYYAARLGASERFMIVASAFGSFIWRRLPQPDTLAPETPFSLTVDLDLHGDRLALLGANRGRDDPWSGDEIVWTGRLGGSLEQLEPAYSTLQPGGARKMAVCHFLELGAVRFLADGSLIVVPGIEPGAYLYGPDGRLRRVWQTEPLGLPDGCRLDDSMGALLARDPRARNLWVNRRRVLDEILPLPEGPALVLRSVEAGETRWDLALLRPDGTLSIEPLPVRSPSDQSHLRGDVRGGKVVLLILETNGLDPPKAQRRLIVLGPAAATPAPTSPLPPAETMKGAAPIPEAARASSPRSAPFPR